MLAPVLALWLAPAPPETASSARLPEDVPLASDPSSGGSAATAEPASGGDTTEPNKPASGGFFGGDVTTAAPAPVVEGPSKAPPMPEVEELPSRAAPPAKKPGLSALFGPKDRKPVSGGGVGFFDPGKLDDTGPGGSGGIQVRGYLGFNFTVAQRTDLSARDPETGTFPQLKTLPYFGGGAANLYVGAPIYSDVVYARIAFEFISIPAPAPSPPTSPRTTPRSCSWRPRCSR
ncbi:hypothetical protein [Nannocystis pusilla]|uniref:hypothetical protein n=1 Tax=Nannocystis pusilla TaxID=889268 RepID=UPI003B7F1B04